MFYIKVRNLKERTRMINFLKNRDVNAVFHYIPLHTAPAGQRFGVFCGEDIFTTKESERIIRLPMYYGLGDDVEKVVKEIFNFYK